MSNKIKNLNQALLQAMDRYGEQTCFQIKQGRRYQKISYRQLQMLTFHMAQFFRKQGIAKDERVVLVADNSLEWMAAYMGCLFSGGVAVPLHASHAPGTLNFILQDSGARLAILQEQAHLQAVLTNWTSDTDDGLSNLQAILTINLEGEPPSGVTPMKTLLAEPSPTTEEEADIRSGAENIAP